MADLVPTQSVIVSGTVKKAVLGEAVTVPGQLLRWDSLIGKYVLASSGLTLLESEVSALALELGVVDDTIKILNPGGIVDLGAVLSQGGT